MSLLLSKYNFTAFIWWVEIINLISFLEFLLHMGKNLYIPIFFAFLGVNFTASFIEIG